MGEIEDRRLRDSPRFTDKTADEAEEVVEVIVPLRTYGVRDDLPPRVRELMDEGLSEVLARQMAAFEAGELGNGKVE